MIPNAEILPEFNMNRITISKTGRKLECCLYNTGFYCCRPKDRKMPMKPIQTPSAPIEPREDSAHHLVET